MSVPTLLICLALAALLVWLGRRVLLRVRMRQALLMIHRVLQEQLPECAIQGVEDGMLVLAPPQGEGVRVNLHRLIELAMAPGETAAEREQHLTEFCMAMAEAHAEGQTQAPLELERLRPRLLDRDTLTDLRRQADYDNLPAHPLGSSGLYAVLVQDSPRSVRFLHRKQVQDLPEPFDRTLRTAQGALDSPRFREAVRNCVQSGHRVVFQSGDSYDAARLLLIPQLLHPGESLVALVPDRDTLALAPLPSTPQERAELLALASQQGDRPLLDMPLVVSTEGWRRME